MAAVLHLLWGREYSVREIRVALDNKDRALVLDFASKLGAVPDAQAIQTLVRETARSHGIEPSYLFKLLYKVLLGVESGPRLGPYIIDVGPSKVAEKLLSATTAKEP